jgi:hypothetical protein
MESDGKKRRDIGTDLSSLKESSLSNARKRTWKRNRSVSAGVCKVLTTCQDRPGAAKAQQRFKPK